MTVAIPSTGEQLVFAIATQSWQEVADHLEDADHYLKRYVWDYVAWRFVDHHGAPPRYPGHPCIAQMARDVSNDIDVSRRRFVREPPEGGER